MKSTHRLVAGLLLLSAATLASSQNAYELVDLGPGSGAVHLNNKGQAILTRYLPEIGNWECGLWSCSSGFVSVASMMPSSADWLHLEIYNLGVPTSTSLGVSATRINNLGQIAGDCWVHAGVPVWNGYSYNFTNWTDLAFPFRWDPASGATVMALWEQAPLFTLNGPNHMQEQAYIAGFNDNGIAVGTAFGGLGNWDAFPAVWAPDGTLMRLPEGWETHDINNAGLVVGSILPPEWYPWTAHAYNPATRSDMPLNGVYGMPNTIGWAVNDQGQIAGVADDWLDDFFTIERAVLWDSTTANPIVLGAITRGGVPDANSRAIDINNSGVVVGLSTSEDSAWNPMNPTKRAFVWDPVHQTRDLNDLNGDGTLDHEGWVLAEPVAINDNGEILGNGLKDGEWRAFLLKPITAIAAPGDNVAVTPTEGTTLRFDSVETPGVVTVAPTVDAPPTPAGFSAAGMLYDVAFTGAIAPGSFIEISFPYDPTVFPYDAATSTWSNGQPRLLHYSSVLAAWENVTTGVDPTTHTVTGKTSSLSPFAIVYQRPIQWSGALQPVNADGTSIFRLGSTVPVKFKLLAPDAGYGGLTARLTYQQVAGDGTLGSVNDAGTTASATTGNLFRYDASADQYVFNWSTRNLAPGVYQLSVDFGDGVGRSFRLGLKR